MSSSKNFQENFDLLKNFNVESKSSISECLIDLENIPKRGLFTSRMIVTHQNITKKFYCLDQNTMHPISMFMRVNLTNKQETNVIIQRLFDFGIINFWQSKNVRIKSDETETSIVSLQMAHEMGIFVILFVGLLLSVICFCIEKMIFASLTKTKNPTKFIMIASDLIDGDRHLFCLDKFGEWRRYQSINIRSYQDYSHSSNN